MFENSLINMSKCWKGMHYDLKLQLDHIITSFQKSFYAVEHVNTSHFYGNLHGSVLRACLRHIAEEFFRVEYVGSDTKNL